MIIRWGNVTRIQNIAMIYTAEWRDNMTARNSNRKVMLFVSPSQFPISFKEIVPAPENRNPTRVATNNPITRERFPTLAKTAPHDRTLSSILRNFFTSFPIVKCLKTHDSCETIFHIRIAEFFFSLNQLISRIINYQTRDSRILILKYDKDLQFPFQEIEF